MSTVKTIEVSRSTNKILVNVEGLGGVIFAGYGFSNDPEDLVKEFTDPKVNWRIYSRMRTYEQYKAEENDWTTIYKAGE